MCTVNESDIRKKLEGSLRRRFLPAFWERLRGDGVKEYLEHLEGYETGVDWAELRSLAEDVLSLQQDAERDFAQHFVQSGLPDVGAEDSSYASEPETATEAEFSDEELESEPLLSAYTTARGRALSEYAAGVADQHPDVIEFRDKVLCRQRLTPDESWALLQSPAAAFFAPNWFERWKVPVVGHTAEVAEPYDPRSVGEEVDHRVTLRVEPPAITRRVRYAHPDTPISDGDQIDARACITVGEKALPPGGVPPGEKKLSYTDQTGSPRKPFLWPGSLLDHLRRISNELADMFGWKQEEAVWFVLTGETPQIKPLSVRVKVKGGRTGVPLWSVTINAAPWVPHEEVERAFGRMQQQVLQVRSRRMSSRKMGPRALEVYQFVREQERLHEDRPTWSKLLELWNRRHPDKRFETYNNFRQYFMRGAKAVEAPGFKPPELKKTPPKVQAAVNAMEERMVKMLQAYAKKTGNAPFLKTRGKAASCG